jgi:hypothetical protein
MKVKINVTQNEMYALLTALRVQKQQITEFMLFDAQNKHTSLSAPELMIMFDQTDNIYQQVLNYVSESMRKEFKERDIDYIHELHDIRDSILHEGK